MSREADGTFGAGHGTPPQRSTTEDEDSGGGAGGRGVRRLRGEKSRTPRQRTGRVLREILVVYKIPKHVGAFVNNTSSLAVPQINDVPDDALVYFLLLHSAERLLMKEGMKVEEVTGEQEGGEKFSGSVLVPQVVQVSVEAPGSSGSVLMPLVADPSVEVPISSSLWSVSVPQLADQLAKGERRVGDDFVVLLKGRHERRLHFFSSTTCGEGHPAGRCCPPGDPSSPMLSGFRLGRTGSCTSGTVAT